MTTVVVLMGLPGSGKSTLSNRILNALAGVIHLEYDAVAQEGNLHEENERLLAWRLSRRIVLQRLVEKLRRPGIILLDDNFHLSSMRKQVYQVCQEGSLDQTTTIRFGILWVDTPVSVCLERNRLRSLQRRVSDEIIHKMQTTLEPPKFNRETTCFMKVNDHTSTDSIVHFLSSLSIVQPPPHPQDPTKLEEEQRSTRENRFHQLDQLLRTWVGFVAQVRRCSVIRANAVRKEQLAKFRIADEELDKTMLVAVFMDLVTEDWTKDEIESLYTRLQGTLA